MGMAFMVISGLVALLHSLVCSLINVEFTMRVPLTPCAEELCRLPECVEFKKTHGLPSRRFEYRLFGIHLTGIPRNVLHLLAGGHLQLILFLHQKFTPITLLSSTIAIRFLWEIVFSTLGNLDGGRMLWNDSTKQGSEKRVSEEDSSTSISNSSPSLESNSWTYAGAVGSLLFHFAIFLVGIVGFCLGLFGILMHLFYLICPFVIMHMESIIETSSWKEWDSSKPCAQLWKDDLEDLLWWF
jgi:hypothetical protein